jgi:hypothetical protein
MKPGRNPEAGMFWAVLVMLILFVVVASLILFGFVRETVRYLT